MKIFPIKSPGVKLLLFPALVTFSILFPKWDKSFFFPILFFAAFCAAFFFLDTILEFFQKRIKFKKPILWGNLIFFGGVLFLWSSPILGIFLKGDLFLGILLALVIVAFAGSWELEDYEKELAKVPAQLLSWTRSFAIWGALIWFFWILLLVPAIDMVRSAENRSRVEGQLKTIALAFHEFVDKHGGRLPPVAVFDKKENPLLSWRVLLLPNLNQKDLFNEFHLDEPWDSPHNITLLPKIPGVYVPPPLRDNRTEPFTTCYQVIVGKGAAFEGRKGLKFPRDFPDGSSSTIFLVEARDPVPWTKPADLTYEPDHPLPPLGGFTRGWCGFTKSYEGNFFAMGDGSIRFMLASDIAEKKFRAMITRNGREKNDLE